jgi:hypothetical protein
MGNPFFKKYASSNQVLIQVALFWKNVQIQPFFMRQIALFLDKYASSTSFSRQVTLFSRNVQLQPAFQDMLHFSQKMCNSNHFF